VSHCRSLEGNEFHTVAWFSRCEIPITEDAVGLSNNTQSVSVERRWASSDRLSALPGRHWKTRTTILNRTCSQSHGQPVQLSQNRRDVITESRTCSYKSSTSRATAFCTRLNSPIQTRRVARCCWNLVGLCIMDLVIEPANDWWRDGLKRQCLANCYLLYRKLFFFTGFSISQTAKQPHSVKSIRGRAIGQVRTDSNILPILP